VLMRERVKKLLVYQFSSFRVLRAKEPLHKSVTRGIFE
jgi:hypothetical protein